MCNFSYYDLRPSASRKKSSTTKLKVLESHSRHTRATRENVLWLTASGRIHTAFSRNPAKKKSLLRVLESNPNKLTQRELGGNRRRVLPATERLFRGSTSCSGRIHTTCSWAELSTLAQPKRMFRGSTAFLLLRTNLHRLFLGGAGRPLGLARPERMFRGSTAFLLLRTDSHRFFLDRTGRPNFSLAFSILAMRSNVKMSYTLKNK